MVVVLYCIAIGGGSGKLFHSSSSLSTKKKSWIHAAHLSSPGCDGGEREFILILILILIDILALVLILILT
jgi:hypothetical protein